jgi:ABC-type multidrug transport system fused ATPase/permease subunit
VFFALSGLFEGLGIASLLPFLQASLNNAHGDEYFGLRGDELAGAALGALLLLGGAAAVLRYLADLRLYRIQANLEASMRQRMTAALFAMRWTSYSSISFGDAAKSVLSDGQQVGTGINGLVSGLGYSTIALVFVVVAALISLELTAITVAFGVAMMVVYRMSGRHAARRGRKLSDQATAVTDLVEELFNNFKYYRSTGLQAPAIERADCVYSEWRDDFVRVWRYQPATRLGFDVAGLTFIAGVLAIAVLVLGNSAADAFVFLALFYRLSPKLQLAQQGLLLAKAQGSWWIAWKERYDFARSQVVSAPGSLRLTSRPTIAAEAVSFVYPGRAEPALRDVTWTLPPGGCLAIVGESGSGKTTMLDLVTGLLAPSSGSLWLDDSNLTAIDRDWWQKRIGLVMQDAPVFYGTIFENITWGAERDSQRATRCAAQANIDDLISKSPDGLDAQVGHRGSMLSGGQRQRLALARALYRDPWLLVLDEATSALDTESEQAIQRALVALKGTCSILLVAHRLKTVEMADSIVVLTDGAIVESGSWEDLAVRRSGAFRRMLELQGTSAVLGSRRD